MLNSGTLCDFSISSLFYFMFFLISGSLSWIKVLSLSHPHPQPCFWFVLPLRTSLICMLDLLCHLYYLLAILLPTFSWMSFFIHLFLVKFSLATFIRVSFLVLICSNIPPRLISISNMIFYFSLLLEFCPILFLGFSNSD